MRGGGGGMMKRHYTGVLNQFQFDGGKGRTACMALCIQALYHLYDVLEKYRELLTRAEWSAVMERGTRLWQLWRDLGNERLFPLVDEILKVPECKDFYRLFDTEREEYAGLVLDSGWIDNIEGPLSRVVAKLYQAKQTSCAIITLPVHYTIGILCHLKNLFLFDPHGEKATQHIEFVQFDSPIKLVSYLIERHQFDSIDKNEYIAYLDELDVVNQYGYSATVFTVK